MDANGQRFWLALGGAAWRPVEPGSLDLDAQHLRLASQTAALSYPEEPAVAEARLAIVPAARDAFGTRAFCDADGLTIRATGAFPEPEAVSSAPVLVALPDPVSDLALGFDGLLYVAFGGRVRLHPLSDRYSAIALGAPGFQAWRLAPDPGGGVWVLDRPNRKLARIQGDLWPDPPAFAPPPSIAFQPVQENPNPPHLAVLPDGWLGPDEDPVAIACSPEGRVAILTWTPTAARVRWVGGPGKLGPAAELRGLVRPFSLAWLAEDRFAVLAPGVAEGVVFPWRDGEVFASGEVYPLRDHDGGPWLHGTTLPVEYLSRQPAEGLPDAVLPRPLASISLPAFNRSAVGLLDPPFDSGGAGTPWHRLYLDASLPPGTSLTVHAAASDTAQTPEAIPDLADWHPHHFGRVAAPTQEPRGAWVSQSSELPGHPGFAEDPIEADRTGLFTALIQRSNRPVRTLRGRYLHLKVELRGNLRSTPCLHALRAYGPRFSYQDRYLPALYRESLFGPEADAITPGLPSTRPDFLGRFLANFEGILTPIEDRVAGAWMLTDPRRTPEPALEWLGSWIGVAFESWYPAECRRDYLARAPELFEWRGTLRGLRLALDVATGGGVQAGRIVVVEDHWFRRTLQTVLGVRLDRDFDPLLGGPFISGNSKVGHTLFLSEEGMEQAFLALFDASIQLKSADRAVVDDFFASLAYRVTIMVHEEASAEELTLVERVAPLEAPAHLSVRVRRASAGLMVGLGALLGLDTYLRPAPAREPVEIETTRIGSGNVLDRPASLDPRLEGRPT
jgi:phage tail-like protein